MKTLVQLTPLPCLAESLRLDETLGEEPGSPRARLWRHGPGLVLGMRDMRLPHAEEAVLALRGRGVDVHVRSSGGKLVVLDAGVLNVALAFRGESLPTIEGAFDVMAGLLARLLGEMGLSPARGEIGGSICPGSSDISAGGLKVAGLSQRRKRRMALVHAFLLVEGTGEARVARARSFYDLAGAAEGQGVRSGTMASLEELLPARLRVAEVAGRLRDLIGDLSL